MKDNSEFDDLLKREEEKDRAFRQGLSIGISIATLIVSIIALVVRLLR